MEPVLKTWTFKTNFCKIYFLFLFTFLGTLEHASIFSAFYIFLLNCKSQLTVFRLVIAIFNLSFDHFTKNQFTTFKLIFFSAHVLLSKFSQNNFPFEMIQLKTHYKRHQFFFSQFLHTFFTTHTTLHIVVCVYNFFPTWRTIRSTRVAVFFVSSIKLLLMLIIEFSSRWWSWWEIYIYRTRTKLSRAAQAIIPILLPGFLVRKHLPLFHCKNGQFR